MVVRFTNSSTIGRKRLRNLIAKHYLQKVDRLAAKN
jgi:ribosomal protein S24E